jgi:hypothetical protein
MLIFENPNSLKIGSSYRETVLKVEDEGAKAKVYIHEICVE